VNKPTKKKLEEVLGEFGLDTTGSRDELFDRLQNHGALMRHIPQR
jgi:hypothetical protein